jgi:hypothetical protein
MMPQKTLLQHAVPRSESLRALISQQSWHVGFQNFFLRRVPFSGRSNAKAANKHVQLITTIAKQVPGQEPISLLELGTGHGMLSKNILDRLATHHTDIYNRIQLTLSDYSLETLQFLKESHFLKQHIEKCRFIPTQTVNLDALGYRKYHYAYAAYLYDCFPCQLLQSHSRKKSKLFVETYINSDCILIDTSQGDEKKLTAQPIKMALDQNAVEFIQKFGIAIAPFLEEKLVFDDGTPIDSPNTTVTTYTNSSDVIPTHIQNVMSLLHDGGAYVFSDIFQTNSSDISGLSKSYNGVLCFPLSPHILPTDTPITSQKSFDGTADILLIKKQDTHHLKAVFDQTFCDIGTTPITLFLEALKTHTIGIDKLMSRFKKLSPLDQSDYFLIKETCAYLLNSIQTNKDAIQTPHLHHLLTHYTDKLIQHYAELAVDAWRIKLSVSISQKKPAKEIYHYANNILTLCPDDTDTLRIIGFYNLATQDYDEAARHLHAAFETSSVVLQKGEAMPEILVELKSVLAYITKHKRIIQIISQ